MNDMPDHRPELTVKQWEQRLTLPKFLALEDNQGAHRYLTIDNATEEEAVQFTADAFKYTQYRAVFLYDAYCPVCNTVAHEVTCGHELAPATHLDFIHFRIDVDEKKSGVPFHQPLV